MNKKLKSPLRYPGGKSRWAARIVETFVGERNYIEPFVGGGSIFLEYLNQSPQSNYWINDKYEPVYSFWRAALENGPGLIAQVRDFSSKFPIGRDLYEYLKNSSSKSLVESGARFFVMNRITFSGLSDSGGFSQSAFESRFTESAILRLDAMVSRLPSNLKITNLDFPDLFGLVDKDLPERCFMFLDPPYAKAEGSRLYGNLGDLHMKFDHTALSILLKRKNFKWAMTYDDSELIRSLYSKDFHIVEWSLYYPMTNQSTKTPSRGNELFITNDLEFAEHARKGLNGTSR